jgi:plasmid maintenance system antidote protein VapI
MATKKVSKVAAKKVSKKQEAEREFARLSKGAVSAKKVFEELNKGPLTFGQMMNSIRLCDGELSLAEMSTKLGVSRSHLHDVENDRRTVSPDRAARWAKLLGYHPQQFVQAALQAELDSVGIKMRVSVKAA